MRQNSFNRAMREVVEDSESLSLDDATDRETLIKRLIEIGSSCVDSTNGGTDNEK